MKHLTTTLLVFFYCNSFGQILISQPEMIVFFANYDNKLEAVSQNGTKKVILVSKDFEFIEPQKKQWKDRNHYSCNARVISNADKSVIYMINKKNGDTIQKFDVRIKKLPNPSLYFGDFAPGARATKEATKFVAKYPPEIPLSAEFQIISGTILLPDKTVMSFTGEYLSSEISAALKTFSEDGTILVEVCCKGPDGVVRIIKSTYRL